MKKLLSILFLLCCMIISSCGDSKDVTGGREVYNHYFQKVLKDPKSLEIYEEKYKVDPSDSDYLLWEVDYGAKNGFGGMVRKTMYFKTNRNRPKMLFQYRFDRTEDWEIFMEEL